MALPGTFGRHTPASGMPDARRDAINLTKMNPGSRPVTLRGTVSNAILNLIIK
jgi:hypothetical protein